jgi:glycine dehydrogenase subunit 2
MMKYNPRINERLAALPASRGCIHCRRRGAQGALEPMWRLQEILAEVTGLDAVSLQPAAGCRGS